MRSHLERPAPGRRVRPFQAAKARRGLRRGPAVERLEDRTVMSGGGLDPSFGTAGVATTVVNGQGDTIRALAVQPNGKIVAVGYSTSSVTGINFAVVRYNTDGSVDGTFGTNGIVTTDFGG